MNWLGELLQFSGMKMDYNIKELREIAEELEIEHKGVRKPELRNMIYRELAKRANAI